MQPPPPPPCPLLACWWIYTSIIQSYKSFLTNYTGISCHVILVAFSIHMVSLIIQLRYDGLHLLHANKLVRLMLNINYINHSVLYQPLLQAVETEFFKKEDTTIENIILY